MELIFIFAKFAEYLIINPVWWLCRWVAGFFYPEYSNEFLGVAWFVCLCLIFAFVAVMMLLV